MYLSKGTLLNNRYEVETVLGHGGFGITYAAHDQTLNVRVAIKEYLPRQLATRGEGRTKVSVFTGEARQQYDYGLRKFLEEAQSVARFAHHPNVVSARDYFAANGTAYMVMEYVEGVTLKEYLQKKGGRISFEEAKGIMMPVMDALREVHQAGMLHRDISPDNIYITTSAQVKILDFGAARYFAGEQSKSLSVILKPGYAPEEQYRSKGQQGPWTDVYSTAATLYRALTGETPPEALDRMAEDTLTPPSRLGVSLPAAAEQALLQALALTAGRRFQNMGEFQQALLGNAAVTMGFQPSAASFQQAPGSSYAPDAPPVSVPPQPPVYPPPVPPPSHYPQTPRRSANPAAIAAGIGAGVLALVLLVVVVWRLAGGPSPIPVVKAPSGEKGQGPVAAAIPPAAQAPIPSIKDPVPGPQAVKTRFTSTYDGVITDSATGLEWCTGPARDTDWHTAKSWTETLTVAGGGWRMPTVPEFKTLYQPWAGSNNRDLVFRMTGYRIWTGQMKDGSVAWVFDFDDGRGFFCQLDDAYSKRAFAVRSYQKSDIRGQEKEVPNPDTLKSVPAVIQTPVTPPPGPVVPKVNLEFPRKWRVEWRGGRTRALYTGLLSINNKINDQTFTGSLLVKTPQGYEVSQDAIVSLNESKVQIKCSNSSVAKYPSDNFYLELSGNTMKGYDKDVKGNIGLGVTFTAIN
jgi:serine/threonine protein kinase